LDQNLLNILLLLVCRDFESPVCILVLVGPVTWTQRDPDSTGFQYTKRPLRHRQTRLTSRLALVFRLRLQQHRLVALQLSALKEPLAHGQKLKGLFCSALLFSSPPPHLRSESAVHAVGPGIASLPYSGWKKPSDAPMTSILDRHLFPNSLSTLR
jgi:hypothetical protein